MDAMATNPTPINISDAGSGIEISPYNFFEIGNIWSRIRISTI